MTTYKHTQIGYLMIAITMSVLAIFAWAQISARAEVQSYDSGSNFALTTFMALILFILTSFMTLTVSLDENNLLLKFGYGIFRKRIAIREIVSVARVKNRWYYGWGIRVCFWPKMWIFNVSGLDAVELRMKNGNVYRIGTDEPIVLEAAIKMAASL
jgi:hypothetical protein